MNFEGQDTVFRYSWLGDIAAIGVHDLLHSENS